MRGRCEYCLNPDQLAIYKENKYRHCPKCGSGIFNFTKTSIEAVSKVSDMLTHFTYSGVETGDCQLDFVHCPACKHHKAELYNYSVTKTEIGIKAYKCENCGAVFTVHSLPDPEELAKVMSKEELFQTNLQKQVAIMTNNAEVMLDFFKNHFGSNYLFLNSSMKAGFSGFEVVAGLLPIEKQQTKYRIECVDVATGEPTNEWDNQADRLYLVFDSKEAALEVCNSCNFCSHSDEGYVVREVD